MRHNPFVVYFILCCNMLDWSIEWSVYQLNRRRTMPHESNHGLSPNNTLTFYTSIPIPWGRIFIGILMYIIILVTIFGNLLVLVAVAKNKHLQTVFNFYVINLAVTDMLVAVTAMIFYTTETILGYWPFGEFWCGVWIFFDYGMTFASVFTLIVISIDRFWSVTWSVHYRAHHNINKCVRLIAAVWVLMLVLWLPPCIVDRITHSVPYECIWEPSKNKEFVIIIATIGHHGSFLVMLICYIKVFYVVLNRKKVGANVRKNPDIPRKRESNLVKIYAKSDSDIHLPELPVDIITTNSGRDVSFTQNSDEPLQVAPVHSWKSDPYLKPSTEKSSNDTTSKKCVSNLTIATITGSGAVDSESHYSDSSCKDDHGNKYTRDRCQSDIKRKQKEDRKYEKNERRVFKTLTYIIAGYIICWFPFHVVFDISCAMPESVSPLVYSITFWLSYMNSTINPFLYNFSSKEFRTASKELLCGKKKTCFMGKNCLSKSH